MMHSLTSEFDVLKLKRQHKGEDNNQIRIARSERNLLQLEYFILEGLLYDFGQSIL